MRPITIAVVALLATASLAMPVAGAEPQVQLISDIKPAGGSDPHYLTRASGLVFFSADDGVHGKELWVTDGTEAGTRMVRDINPGSDSSTPRRLTKVGSRVFFSAADGVHGRELWVSDATSGGTKLVRDLTMGSKGNAITSMAAGDGSAYFAVAHRQLWRSDGTARGTELLRTFDGVFLDDAVALGPTLVFGADGLWKTRGTAATTRRLTSAGDHVDQLTRFKGRVYFRWIAAPGYPGAELPPQLWGSDATRSGTERVGQVQDPFDLAVLRDRIYLNGRLPAGSHRLIRSDGTSAGTLPVKPRVGPLWALQAAAGRLWSASESKDLTGEPDSLWVSDGTAAGTALVYGGNEDWFVSDWRGLDCVGVDGSIWFAAGPGGWVGADDWQLTDHELWTSDGTTDGTLEAADIAIAGSSFPRDFVRLGGRVIFTADDGIHGRELWSLSVS